MSPYRHNFYPYQARWGATPTIKSRIRFFRGIYGGVKGMALCFVACFVVAMPGVAIGLEDSHDGCFWLFCLATWAASCALLLQLCNQGWMRLS